MVLVNTDYISGKELEMLRIVSGNMLGRITRISKEIKPSPISDIEHEEEWKKKINEFRELATRYMIIDAETLGADAIVNIRYSTVPVNHYMMEVIVYGTAVRFK